VEGGTSNLLLRHHLLDLLSLPPPPPRGRYKDLKKLIKRLLPMVDVPPTSPPPLGPPLPAPTTTEVEGVGHGNVALMD
jgi:hypothetical protein